MTSTVTPAEKITAEKKGTAEKGTAEKKMSAATQKDLGAELAQLRSTNNSGRMDRSMSVLGVLLGVVGLGIILLSFVQTRGYSDIRNQMDALVLSLFGLSLSIVGSALYIRSSMTRFLRYWLLRMVYEQRDLARESVDD
jgi:hypothetical protein